MAISLFSTMLTTNFLSTSKAYPKAYILPSFILKDSYINGKKTTHTLYL